MTLHDQITKLIDKAIENGWDKNSHGWKVDAKTHLIARAYATGFDSGFDPASINDLLFGDNLSFLKALFGRSRTTLPLHNPDCLNAAIGLVQNPDNDRIPSLYSQVFGGQDV